MEGDRIIPRASIESRNTRESNVIIIDNVVYDVTEFLDDHPGGSQVLLDNGGKDASRCFRDVGHSDIAIDWRAKFRIGVVPEEERVPELARLVEISAPAAFSLTAFIKAIFPPLVLAVIATVIYQYLF